MKIFLSVLFTIITMDFLYQSTNEEEFPEVRMSYTLATGFMSALLFMLYIIK